MSFRAGFSPPVRFTHLGGSWPAAIPRRATGREESGAGVFGFTLVEILVSLVVLQVGLLGVAGMATVAARTLNGARDLEWAVHEARAVADSIMATGASGSGRREAPYGVIWWDVGEGEPLAQAHVTAVDRSGSQVLEIAFLVRIRPEADA